MNANELAEILEDVGMEQKHYDTIQKVATMLRQQQAEIQALKGDGKVCARCGAIAYDPVITQTAKTLTDEEIWQITEDFWKRDWTTLDVGFARAILRKAQEK